MNRTELLEFLKTKGFSDKIIEAFSVVKREEFIPEHALLYAYEDMAIPLEPGTSISQPSTIAFMLTLLNPQDNQKILEIGSGTGYVLALLDAFTKKSEIYGIELNKNFAIKSKDTLQNRDNIRVIFKNGTNGLPEQAPFDRIIMSAACKSVPYSLLSQLSENGILVAPVGDKIVCIEKLGSSFKESSYQGYTFVPMREE